MELTTNINVIRTTRQLLSGALSTEVFGGARFILVRPNRALLFNITFKSYYEKQRTSNTQIIVRMNSNILIPIKQWHVRKRETTFSSVQ